MSSTPLWFGALSPPSIKQRTLSPKIWTCVGALAIPLWATWPALAIRTFEIPLLEFLALMFLVGWLVLTRLERPTDSDKGKPPLTQSWLPPAALAVSLSGGDIAFIAATHRIPAAQATLITYLWPVMIVVFG